MNSRTLGDSHIIRKRSIGDLRRYLGLRRFRRWEGSLTGVDFRVTTLSLPPPPPPPPTSSAAFFLTKEECCCCCCFCCNNSFCCGEGEGGANIDLRGFLSGTGRISGAGGFCSGSGLLRSRGRGGRLKERFLPKFTGSIANGMSDRFLRIG